MLETLLKIELTVVSVLIGIALMVFVPLELARLYCRVIGADYHKWMRMHNVDPEDGLLGQRPTLRRRCLQPSCPNDPAHGGSVNYCHEHGGGS